MMIPRHSKKPLLYVIFCAIAISEKRAIFVLVEAPAKVPKNDNLGRFTATAKIVAILPGTVGKI